MDINPSDLSRTIITDIQFLRQISKETSLEEIEKRKLIPLIKYALYKGWTFGYGLAAIQVGIPLRAGWYWLPTDKDIRKDYLGEGHNLINPEIIESSGSIVLPGEGCLSIPNQVFTTKRFKKISFKNNGLIQTAEGLEAQIIQHEIDHMNGALVIDREYKKVAAGRNDHCICGSGKKYKKCCLGKE